jgi:hypothetical protein
MRFRLGLLVGLVVGYYLGAQAGRERYEQMNRLFAKARGSEPAERATEAAKAAIDLTVERARTAVEEHLPQSNGAGNQTVWPN